MERYYEALLETGISINRPSFLALNEASKVKVTDEVLSNMIKFITDKYNAIDFSEIEKSAGDIMRFKYRDVMNENRDILHEVYDNTVKDGTEPGAEKYLEVLEAYTIVMDHLMSNRQAYSTLYKQGNGVVQLMYVSLVSACIYSIGTLVNNTIRFVTVEQDTDCQVLFEEIPGTIKHIHIKNLLNSAKDIQSFQAVLNEFLKKNITLHESITVSAGVMTLLIGVGIIFLIPKVIQLIREIIYSVYYNRVKTVDMLTVQIDLLNTNIESLEQGRGKKKVIARQKKIVQKLEKWRNRNMVKTDTTTTMVKKQIDKENKAIQIQNDHVENNYHADVLEDSPDGTLLI